MCGDSSDTPGRSHQKSTFLSRQLRQRVTVRSTQFSAVHRPLPLTSHASGLVNFCLSLATAVTEATTIITRSRVKSCYPTTFRAPRTFVFGIGAIQLQHLLMILCRSVKVDCCTSGPNTDWWWPEFPALHVCTCRCLPSLQYDRDD